MVRLFYLPAIAALLLCCEPANHAPNKFSDGGLLKIADLQDRRLPDSLYPYFNHDNPFYRRDAVKAFGSLQDSSQTEKIGKLLLMDGDTDVREAAAFALGQIRHPSCERILLGALVKEKNPEIIFEILQAYGKVTRRWQLDSALFGNDTLKTAGLAWSLYRAALRGKTDSIANRVAARLIQPEYSKVTRLGAAHYFARGASDFQKHEQVLRIAALKDTSPEIRMAAATALGKTPSDSALHTLKKIIKTESDARVVINAIRALNSFPFNRIKNYLYECLHHKDIHVGITASEIILKTLPENEWIEVSALTNQVRNGRIKANLYGAALKAGKNKDLAAEIQEQYQASADLYQRTELLGSLKHFPASYPFIANEIRTSDTAMVRSAAAAVLVAMNRSDNFPRALSGPFASLYQELITNGEDPAVLGTIASALAEPTLGYRAHIRDVTFLRAAKQRLTLPEHNEALQSIEAAIALLSDTSPKAVENTFNHPIDWALVKKIPEGQRATIQTSRGSIIIRLFVNEAPGSVANFVALAQKDYFDGLPVHRVVPNFVVQGGCKRGDGWGSEDYSIRSEFSSRPFHTGAVGMASAGKDTEGTQWFITHSPAPHLDSRYTLFGKVIEGQSVVDYLEVGDTIRDVVVKDFTDQ